MKMSYKKNGFIELLKSGDYIVSSTPFGCLEGYSKIVVRRKTRKSKPFRNDIPNLIRVPIPDEYSKCRTNAEIRKLKQEIKEKLNIY